MKFRTQIIAFILITIFSVNNLYSVDTPKEPNKKSQEYFMKAMDTLQTAANNNIQARQKAALNLFNKSIKADKKNIPAYMWKVLLLMNKKDYKTALKTTAAGIKSSKSNANFMLPQLYMSRGSIFLLTDDKKRAKWAYYEAVKAYKAILKQHKCNVDAIANIPIIYAMVEEKSKALKFIKNNEACYKDMDIKQFKTMIKEFNIDKFLEDLKNQGNIK